MNLVKSFGRPEASAVVCRTVWSRGAGRHPATEIHLPPNIVFIMADDLGYADLSCCGRRDFSTPNIDRIAERGVRFTQAYANSAVCSATRLALITGRYQYRLPLGLEEPLAGKTDVGLPPEHPTLPSLLRDAGYATSLIGKWHLGVLPSVRTAAKRLRPLLGLPHRRAGLLLASQRPRRSRPVGRRCRHRADRLHDGPARRPRRRCHRAPRAGPPPVPAQPALQRAALAVGGAGRSGGVGAAARHAAASLRRRHAADLCPHGPGDGPSDRPRPAGARRQRPVRQHHRHLHQRQRRRALLGHLAVHRHEDRTAGGRAARSRPDLLARSHSRRWRQRAGHDHHGLAADAAGRRRDRARRGLSAGRHEPAAGADRTARALRRASCSGATRPTRSAPCATATSSI